MDKPHTTSDNTSSAQRIGQRRGATRALRAADSQVGRGGPAFGAVHPFGATHRLAAQSAKPTPGGRTSHDHQHQPPSHSPYPVQ